MAPSLPYGSSLLDSSLSAIACLILGIHLIRSWSFSRVGVPLSSHFKVPSSSSASPYFIHLFAESAFRSSFLCPLICATSLTHLNILISDVSKIASHFSLLISTHTSAPSTLLLHPHFYSIHTSTPSTLLLYPHFCSIHTSTPSILLFHPHFYSIHNTSLSLLPLTSSNPPYLPHFLIVTPSHIQ